MGICCSETHAKELLEWLTAQIMRAIVDPDDELYDATVRDDVEGKANIDAKAGEEEKRKQKTLSDFHLY